MKFPWSKPKPTLEEEAMEEALLLDRDILNRELAIIDAQFKVQAQHAKKAFIMDWLQRDTPRPLTQDRS